MNRIPAPGRSCMRIFIFYLQMPLFLLYYDNVFTYYCTGLFSIRGVDTAKLSKGTVAPSTILPVHKKDIIHQNKMKVSELSESLSDRNSLCSADDQSTSSRRSSTSRNTIDHLTKRAKVSDQFVHSKISLQKQQKAKREVDLIALIALLFLKLQYSLS